MGLGKVAQFGPTIRLEGVVHDRIILRVRRVHLVRTIAEA